MPITKQRLNNLLLAAESLRDTLKGVVEELALAARQGDRAQDLEQLLHLQGRLHPKPEVLALLMVERRYYDTTIRGSEAARERQTRYRMSKGKPPQSRAQGSGPEAFAEESLPVGAGTGIDYGALFDLIEPPESP